MDRATRLMQCLKVNLKSRCQLWPAGIFETKFLLRLSGDVSDAFYDSLGVTVYLFWRNLNSLVNNCPKTKQRYKGSWELNSGNFCFGHEPNHVQLSQEQGCWHNLAAVESALEAANTTGQVTMAARILDCRHWGVERLPLRNPCVKSGEVNETISCFPVFAVIQLLYQL